jgi:hypothetical protein
VWQLGTLARGVGNGYAGHDRVVGGGLTTLVCFILVVVKMFQNGQTDLGIMSIVLFFCCGIGLLINFIYGWVKAKQWNTQNIMIAYTVGIVLEFAGTAIHPPDFSQIQQQIQQQQQNR